MDTFEDAGHVLIENHGCHFEGQPMIPITEDQLVELNAYLYLKAEADTYIAEHPGVKELAKTLKRYAPELLGA